jgi:chromosome partitioning protein
LALQGRRVLLVDLDPQANLTHGLNRSAADLSQCIYELLIGQKPDVRAIIQRTEYERLDLLPSHIDVSGAEIELVPMIGRETRLKRSVDLLRNEYDYILIDCLPALSLLTVNALVASDEAIVPLQAHPFAMEGLGKLFEVVGMIREALNPGLAVTGVLVTLFDGRTNVSRETLDRLIKDGRLAPHLFETIVKVNIKIAESQNHGIPVVHYDPRSQGALAYMALCEELMEMEAGCLASEARGRIRSRRAVEDVDVEDAVPAEDDGAAGQTSQDASAQVPAASASDAPANGMQAAAVSPVVSDAHDRQLEPVALQAQPVTGAPMRDRVKDYSDPNFRPRLNLIR